MLLQWAEYAEQNKGTSYKLHIYVAWSKDCDDKTTSLSDVEGMSVNIAALSFLTGMMKEHSFEAYKLSRWSVSRELCLLQNPRCHLAKWPQPPAMMSLVW